MAAYGKEYPNANSDGYRSSKDLHHALWRQQGPGAQKCQLHGGIGRIRRHHGRERQRQNDASKHSRRARQADWRHGAARRQEFIRNPRGDRRGLPPR